MKHQDAFIAIASQNCFIEHKKELAMLKLTGRSSGKTVPKVKTLEGIELNVFLTEFPEEEEDVDEYNTEETMTEESGEEESDTRKVKL